MSFGRLRREQKGRRHENKIMRGRWIIADALVLDGAKGSTCSDKDHSIDFLYSASDAVDGGKPSQRRNALWKRRDGKRIWMLS